MNSDSLTDALRPFAETVSGIKAARLAHIEEQIAEWDGRKLLLKDCSSMDSYSVLEFAYSIPKRLNDILRAMRPAVQASQIVPVTILGRSLLETTAIGCLFLNRMETSLATKNYAKLASDFIKFYAGGRVDGNPVKGFHTNDGLRFLGRVDVAYFEKIIIKPTKATPQIAKKMNDEYRETAGVIKLYDDLSEIAHPNGLGLQYLYPADDAPSQEKVRSHYKHLAGISVWHCQHALAALKKFETFDERFNAAFPDPVGFGDEMAAAGLRS